MLIIHLHLPSLDIYFSLCALEFTCFLTFLFILMDFFLVVLPKRVALFSECCREEKKVDILFDMLILVSLSMRNLNVLEI